MAGTNHPEPVRSLTWFPFSITAAGMILVYLVGSRFEGRWIVLFFSLSWLIHIGVLLLFPRNVSEFGTVVIIGCLAVLCRILLFPYVPAKVGMPAITTKIVSILFDLGTLGFLFVLLSDRCLSLRWSILYALNPVILYSFSGMGGLGSVLLFLLLGAIFFYGRGMWSPMFLCAGLCVPFGWVSAAAVPFLLRRDNWKHLWIWVLMASMAFGLVRHWGDTLLGQKLKHPVSFPGPIRTLVQQFIQNTTAADAVLAILLCAALIFGYRYLHPRISPQHKDDPVSGGFFAMGACLLFSKTVPVWHIAWIVPFLSIRPSASWMVLCLTVGAYFLKAGTDGDGIVSVWLQPLVWMPFGMLFLHDLYLCLHRKKAPVDPSSPETVSVIIPVINEADRIESCVGAAKKHPAVREIIVVDGGSTDATIRKAEQAGAIAIGLRPDGRQPGRGGQISAGIRSATQNLVAIIHADTTIDASMVEKMLALMKKQPMVVGGAVGSVFDAKGWRFRTLELANDFRMVCMGISFGDQVQFFRREPVIRTDLFPEIPLMEDVEFGIRLHRLGRQAYLFGDARVSTRRWKQKGMGHALTVIRLFAVYMLQRLWKRPDTSAMYRAYYGKPKNPD